MQLPTFDEAIQIIINKDPRYTAEAYAVVRESLDKSLQKILETEKTARHMSGPELLEGFRTYALEAFGPITKTVLSRMGIQSTRDVGEIVFNLIAAGIFGKTDDDSIEDFDSQFDFDTAFTVPFLPITPAAPPPKKSTGKSTKRRKSPPKSNPKKPPA